MASCPRIPARWETGLPHRLCDARKQGCEPVKHLFIRDLPFDRIPEFQPADLRHAGNSDKYDPSLPLHSVGSAAGTRHSIRGEPWGMSFPSLNKRPGIVHLWRFPMFAEFKKMAIELWKPKMLTRYC